MHYPEQTLFSEQTGTNKRNPKCLFCKNPKFLLFRPISKLLMQKHIRVLPCLDWIL